MLNCRIIPLKRPPQRYKDLIDPAIRHWEEQRIVAARGGVPFVPTPAIGWDATYRAQRGVDFKDAEGLHPYSPVVVDNSPDLFAKMFAAAVDFTTNNVPEGQQHLTIFAWNEYTEGASLVPMRHHTYGHMEKIGKPYLEKVESVLFRQGMLRHPLYVQQQLINSSRPY